MTYRRRTISIYIRLACAAVLTIGVVVQLFLLDKLPKLVGSGVGWVVVVLASAAIGIISLPYLLQMDIPAKFERVSAVVLRMVVTVWLLLAIAVAAARFL